MRSPLSGAASLERLRERTSAKWRYFEADVIPAWIAEMDYPLADPIAQALHAAVDRSDTGYRSLGDLPESLASFAEQAWGWVLDPEQVLVLPDVLTCIAWTLAHVSKAGDGVVINSPVYPPFFSTVRDIARRRLVDVPLIQSESGTYEYDLEAMEVAFSRPEVSTYLLCSPHNPTGTVPSRETLIAIAEAAHRHKVTVVSDEIHAPLTYPGVVHTPFLSVAPPNMSAMSLLSASKAWNVPGLKCAQIVTSNKGVFAELQASLPLEVTYSTGHFGVIAAIAAYRAGQPWLEEVRGLIAGNAVLLGELLGQSLPLARFSMPSASYLGWIDFGGYGIGDDPAAYFLEHARVALSPGTGFGDSGAGYARLNFGTTPQILGQIIERLALAVTVG